jgi:hypothetical protein
MTMTKTRPTSVETVDLTKLDHLNQHPALKVLFEHRSELRARLGAVEEEGKALRRTLYGLHDDATFAGSVQRREVEDTLADREREALSLETTLRTLQGEIETAQETAKAQLLPIICEEGRPLLVELLDVLERLADVKDRYEAYAQRSRRMLNSALVPQFWLLAAVPATMVEAQRVLARLQQRSAT